MQSVLFHLGLLDRLPVRGNGRAGRRAADWARITERAPTIAATINDYLDQMSVRLRPNSLRTIDTSLRLFAGYLVDNHPDVTAIAAVRRTHVQGYKGWLAARHGHRGPVLANQTLRGRLGTLAAFFARLEELDITDAPTRSPVLRSDLPIKDDPLPRFIDDAASTKLHAAAQAHPDLFTRTAVELLARTGLRKSELLGLTVDAVVQIGSSYWLRIPVGKLHTDRYVPLHPQLKTLLDQWLAQRGDTTRSNLMFLERGRQINASRLDHALASCAADAGIGHVTAHQLRHTLATQAINRGMSLEAIAALLGHKSLSMTLVYARIADRTVADEYFAVTEKVEALYDQPRQLPADAEGTKMAQLRREAHRRMLGNGYCARPVELDCHFESVCEACTFFVTTIEFRPTLQRQRDDAADKGQVGRQKIFDGLLDRLDQSAS
jgi:site-specific recombinase XerD